MSLIATAVKHLLAAGVTGDALVAAIADMEAAQPKDAAAEKRRAWDRERKRAARVSTGIPPESADNADEIPSLDKSPQTPKINPTPHTHGEGAPTREAAPKAWACPEGVEPQHWRDFRANRRRKKLTDTDTAYAGQLRLIERFSSDEWPPGELVRISAENGWAKIVDPSEYETPRNGQRSANNHREAPSNPMLAGLQLLRSQQQC